MGYVDLYLSGRRISLGEGEEVAKLIGVPFDSTSSYRPGSRFGPDAIREAFSHIEVYSPELSVDLERLRVDDLGNLKFTSNVEEMLDALGKVVSELVGEGSTVGILGGEHTLTLASFQAMPEDTALLVFDAHFDIREEYGGARVSHATFLRRLIEKIGSDRIMHLGGRAACREEWESLEELSLANVPSSTIMLGGAERLVKEFLSDKRRVYVSIDLDVLDPAYAPAVGNPEPLGLTTHQLIRLLHSIRGKEVVGFDICEYTPIYDNGATGVVAAKLLADMLSLSYLARAGGR
ncbi:MAG: agmatinase [Thaumarchaeota archaeon]|nr:agmatinase [Nitrososphaerota archaeon]